MENDNQQALRDAADTLIRGEQAFRDALVALGAEIPTIGYDRENPHFKSKYATLAAIMERLRPLLMRYGFVLSHSVGTRGEGEITVTTSLLHRSGSALSTTLAAKPKDLSPQAAGSCITYLRRYGILALLAIATDEDDDGEAAQDRDDARASSSSATRAELLEKILAILRRDQARAKALVAASGRTWSELQCASEADLAAALAAIGAAARGAA